ncbi:hypothetical protein INS49_014559 [Diaporthe citri]|uniref:uncharacterized protein n=1 Tax=Diaporthe citri TaxID=83186 RepID=UPI001C811B82|nr:uncharacterized protein INS49_014559 [Diaporthe citri]KAG6356685.1 hypothetical protein INS49_014559 [Diaporthe citri]
MLSDAPTAAWHPAMMPNFSADVAADASISESDKPYNPRPEAAPSAQSEEPPAPEPVIDAPRTRESSVADEWFPNYEVGSPRKQDPEPQAEMPVRLEEPELGSGLEAGDAPLQEEEPWAHNEETPADVVDTIETDEVAQPQAEAIQDPQDANSSAPKHVSSDSFARTVSHQPNWMDDEEPEWSLPRAETDLFNRYMPPNERTNSFPVVPQSEHHENEVVEPLPANQAEDVLHEIEHESESLTREDEDGAMSHSNNALHQDNFWGDDDAEAGFITQGGDMQAPEDEASDARYAEGLPLIDHQDAGEPAQTESSEKQDPFSLDGEDDDFFDQVAAGGNDAEAENFSPGQLERKPTMQVLNGLDTGGSKGLGGLVEDTLEEEKEDEDERRVEPVAQEEPTKPTEDSVAAEAPRAAGQEAQEPRGEDIAAKWSEAFASDDDDGFLLEDEPVADGSDQKAVDPSAFFLDDDEGFLEDVEDTTAPQAPQPSSNISQPAQTPASTTGSRYLPTSTTQPGAARSPNPYIPSASPAVPQPQILNSVPLTPPVAANPYTVQPPPLQHSTTAPLGAHPARPPAVNKAQSFADKAKGGYHSPYDLPMEVVKPKKRASLQQMPRASPAPVSGPPAPPRTSSMHSQGPPVSHISPAPAHGSMAPGPDQMQNPTPTISPQSSVHPGQAPPDTKRPQQLKPKASFFEDLPSSHKLVTVLPSTTSGLNTKWFGTSPDESIFSRASCSTFRSDTTYCVASPAQDVHRSNSTSYEPRLNRMTSLPPTREVEEEDPSAQPTVGAPPGMAAAQSAVAQDFQQGQFAPESPQRPPVAHATYNPDVMSAPKRKISYGPAPVTGIVPPPRSSTGSPGAMSGLRSPIKASEMVPRPSSAYSPSPVSIANVMSPNGVAAGPTPAVSGRPRGMSQKLNLIPPTDGLDVPRYGMNQPAPMIVRSPGEVVIKTIKDVQPLEERLAKFPGPLKGKSKKKETIAWLTAGIQELEQGLPNPGLQSHLSHEDKRATERVLLWKVLRTFIENDGVLEGNPAVEKAVRDILANTTTGQSELASPIYTTGANLGSLASEPLATQMQSDSVDPATVQQLKESLMAGEREKAVWDAADKRLWGHALLIANTVSPELYHKVSQEFIKKEVNFPGRSNESLAALYAVLSGNHAECVDELVPTHARAGVQLIASTSRSTRGGVDGLEKWRETLNLVLSNRSAGDVQALNSLGNLLSEYGRAEAAHICFLFSRTATVFGGLDDPQAQFVLVGADHRKQAQQFFKETEALLLSEVYEYGLSLSGASHFATGVPHLAVYKLQHAITLAEYGFRDKAMQYCDIISKDMSAQTRRSPYHHVLLEATVEDLRQRIAQSPHKEASGSWISKPSMNKVSDSMWSRFNKFVAGDENETPGQGSPKLGDDSGPFGRIAGGTPTISRPASASNATGMEMFGSPNGLVAVRACTARNKQCVTLRPGSSGGYEPPSYQPQGFEPPPYLPNPEPDNDNAEGTDESKPKKKSFMDDDDDDFPSMRSMTPGEKSKAEKDKENEEMFRKVAEEEAKRAEAEKAAKSKKGWGLTSWFGGGGGSKKDSLENSPNKPIRAKLGEKSSFVYDPEQKRWVNKAAGAEESAPKSATPPPPRATPRPAGAGTPPPPGPSSSAPPLRPTPPVSAASSPNLSGPSAVPPSMIRSASNASSVAGGPPSAPPSRPATSMSNASSIDDLLGAAMPRKGASGKGKKKGGRYVDVMAK